MSTSPFASPFASTPEQDELRRTVRTFMTEKSPEAEVRRLMATTTGYDPAVRHEHPARFASCG
ncbi:hypothetical protein Ga0074812_13485 [Parafrankia irregularis]|uniref:Acyl-CoA dehydrogenase, N-terminal domain n=1 Tax=Parafrankia irregularis TaxID=795642 RepID=A0A0S4QZT2_9ACTN|nr:MULTISPECIES: hypothetical protein [Parafrankia]MBE3202783.1 hypothetical protein [Parafrankia sp. CH37]CUU60054.1 hypothetical protein Ga0074812_13485 [Parafrankia irregularis]